MTSSLRVFRATERKIDLKFVDINFDVNCRDLCRRFDSIFHQIPLLQTSARHKHGNQPTGQNWQLSILMNCFGRLLDFDAFENNDKM